MVGMSDGDGAPIDGWWSQPSQCNNSGPISYAIINKSKSDNTDFGPKEFY